MTKLSVAELYRKNLSKIKEICQAENFHALPRIEKVVISAKVGKIRAQKDLMEQVEKVLLVISGQKPIATISRKSISDFKLRKGERVGYKVTLRGKRMYDFLDRLINVILPRIRDLKPFGLKSFDNGGSLTIGFKDTQPFPEIGYDMIKVPTGLSVTICCQRCRREIAPQFFGFIGFPTDKGLSIEGKKD